MAAVPEGGEAADSAKGSLDEAPDISQTLKRLEAVIAELQLPGSIHYFGSWANGLRTRSSDCDVVYVQADSEVAAGETPTMVLQRFATCLPKHGFHTVVTVFHAAIPLLKAVDSCGTDIDLCVQNLLGYHNSHLLSAYCSLDERVALLGQRVKHWARHFDVCSSIDGHMNSYAYSLLSIFFLMYTKPAVVPNLQALADGGANLIPDGRWGADRAWDCSFWTETRLIPRSSNKESLGELLFDFFTFYSTFDFKMHAVSIRCAHTAAWSDPPSGASFPDKGKMKDNGGQYCEETKWYVEDPFDLGHNLAAKCTVAGRQRICTALQKAVDAMRAAKDKLAAFDAAFSAETQDVHSYYLKCRVHPQKSSPEIIARSFADFKAVAVYFPLPPSNLPGGQWRVEDRPEAYLEFSNDDDRKQAHTLNETYVSGWQLRLFVCSRHALEDARGSGCIYEKVDGISVDKATSSTADGAEDAPKQDALETQKQRVLEGLEHAEARDELEVLEQRAKALGLLDEAKEAATKLKRLPVSYRGPARVRANSGDARGYASPKLGPQAAPGAPGPPRIQDTRVVTKLVKKAKSPSSVAADILSAENQASIQFQ